MIERAAQPVVRAARLQMKEAGDETGMAICRCRHGRGPLYACLLALPMTGYLRFAALTDAVTPFGLVPLPVLPPNVPVVQIAERSHDVTSALLGAILIPHIAGAALHRSLDARQVLPHIAIGC